MYTKSPILVSLIIKSILAHIFMRGISNNIVDAHLNWNLNEYICTCNATHLTSSHSSSWSLCHSLRFLYDNTKMSMRLPAMMEPTTTPYICWVVMLAAKSSTMTWNNKHIVTTSWFSYTKKVYFFPPWVAEWRNAHLLMCSYENALI